MDENTKTMIRVLRVLERVPHLSQRERVEQAAAVARMSPNWPERGIRQAEKSGA
jgi:hypothetical protein